MTDDEIADVTRAVAEHTGKRGLTVAADGGWWTGKTVEFARYCREVGADVLDGETAGAGGRPAPWRLRWSTTPP